MARQSLRCAHEAFAQVVGVVVGEVVRMVVGVVVGKFGCADTGLSARPAVSLVA